MPIFFTQRWNLSILALLFRLFDVLAPNHICIIWPSNEFAMSVPDEALTTWQSNRRSWANLYRL